MTAFGKSHPAAICIISMASSNAARSATAGGTAM
jgi:hypothetical protein